MLDARRVGFTIGCGLMLVSMRTTASILERKRVVNPWTDKHGGRHIGKGKAAYGRTLRYNESMVLVVRDKSRLPNAHLIL